MQNMSDVFLTFQFRCSRSNQ